MLILGGTSEGRRLAQQLSADERFRTLLSYAGRTETLHAPGTPHRVGGFGGIDGLATFLREGEYDALVDTTHPFAARISTHAVAAAQHVGVPLVRLARPVWQAQPGDQWTLVDDMAGAAAALGRAPRRVFLTVGRLEIAAFASAPQHDYLARAVDTFETGLPSARVLASRGPFALDDERRLLVDERIELMVSKNSGTAATYPKIRAARELGVPVIMVARPYVPPAREVTTMDELVSWLVQRHGASSKRAVTPCAGDEST